MPTPPNRRIRYTLTAIGALGLIGAGSAAIVAGTASGDREIRLTATAPDAATNAGAAAAADLEDTANVAAPSTEPTASGSAAPSASASATPSPSTSASARSQARPKPSATRTRSKTPSPKPTRTTQAPTEGSSTVAGEILRLVNAEREKAGCSGLSSESRLDAAAQRHSGLQADQNEMSHQLPGEASMGDRVTAEGYRWRGLGENVAAGYPNASAVMDGWMNSPGHKANILNCGFEELGVGLAKSSSGTQYWTQVFATPA